VATITFELDFLGALVSMLAYSIAIVVCPHDFRAALALKGQFLKFLADFFVQRFEFFFWYLSAVRASKIFRVFVVNFLALPAEHILTFRAHHRIKNVA